MILCHKHFYILCVLIKFLLIRCIAVIFNYPFVKCSYLTQFFAFKVWLDTLTFLCSLITSTIYFRWNFERILIAFIILLDIETIKKKKNVYFWCLLQLRFFSFPAFHLILMWYCDGFQNVVFFHFYNK